jgi:hypothetical protein
LRGGGAAVFLVLGAGDLREGVFKAFTYGGEEGYELEVVP